MIEALGKLKWLMVVENFETETAAFWKAKDLAEEYYGKVTDPEKVDTEVFLLPASCFAEKDGTFVNSSRWLQWKHKASDPPGDAKDDQEIIARLFLKLRELYQEEGGPGAESFLAMDWSYANPVSPSLTEVAKEINGREVATGRQVPGFGALKDDGSTLVRQLAVFGLLYRGRQHDAAPRAGRSDRPGALRRLGLELARQPAGAL